MRRIGFCWLGSVLVASVAGCGARSQLDNSGYSHDNDSSDIGSDTVNSTATEPVPTVMTPPVTPPPTAIPTTLPPFGTATSGPIVVPTIAPPPVVPPTVVNGPCTDQDAPDRLWRIVLPQPGPQTPPLPTTCGDGHVGGGELCDDGNLIQGDGCDSACKSEPYFDCALAGSPCLRVEVCGDGTLGDNEACDDANSKSGDGCSASCQTEAGSVCSRAGQPCVPATTCGDGVVAPPEQCEPAGASGCSTECTVMPGWVCSPSAACFTRCGDGILAGFEQCDDGNVDSDDGCHESCGVEWEYCLATGSCAHLGVGTCGNALVEAGEACDEGGATATCSGLCQLEPQCGADSTCQDLCGDGVVSFEECDDGNQRPDDGCSPTCTLEAGYSCTLAQREPPPSGEPLPLDADAGALGAAPPNSYLSISVCQPKCGDGLQQRGEQCDPGVQGPVPDDPVCDSYCRFQQSFCGDGPTNGDEFCDDGVNDGSSAQACPPGCAKIEYCGDGIVQPDRERCDFGRENNHAAYGTCTSTCQLAARCGDGLVQSCGDEECDDGNRDNGDGCSVTCKAENAVLLR